MGRTVPSFRIAVAQEEASWRQFLRALSTRDRAGLDRIFRIARLYVPACMLSCRPVRIQPIMMAIVFHHYKQLAGMAGGSHGALSKG